MPRPNSSNNKSFNSKTKQSNKKERSNYAKSAPGKSSGSGKFSSNSKPKFNDRPASAKRNERPVRPKQVERKPIDDTELQEEKREGIIAGRRAVLELLKSERQINKIFVVDGEREGSVKEIIAIAKERRIPVLFVDKNKLQELLPGEKHQGVAASVPPVNYVELEELLERESHLNVIMLLDGIEDPHNLGAIIRSAEVVGAKGVIIPKRRGVLLTETVAKASAGAVMHLPVARVSNLVQTVALLKEKGYWVAGADMEGTVLWKQDLKQPLVLVIGSEGKGISRLLRENCDFLVGIPVNGKISSLNASVAAGILLYEAARQN